MPRGKARTQDQRRARHTARYGKGSKLPARKHKNWR